MSDKIRDAMIDIETLGTRPGSPVLSIGVVIFDRDIVLRDDYEKISENKWNNLSVHVDTRYVIIDMEAYDFSINPPSASTLKFWLEQGDAARAELTKAGCHYIYLVLDDINRFFTHSGFTADSRVYAAPSNFDIPLMEALYHQHNMQPVWQHRQTACARIVYKIAGVNPKEYNIGTMHNAVDDAKNQTAALLDSLRIIELGKRALTKQRALEAESLSWLSDAAPGGAKS
jgi:hypothetical protein